MKRSIFILTALLFTVSQSFAQIGGIEDSVQDVSETIRTVFPIILGVIFLVGFLFNAGHFFGENADLKKGITRVLVFVLIAGAVVGIFTYLIGIVVWWNIQDSFLNTQWNVHYGCSICPWKNKYYKQMKQYETYKNIRKRAVIFGLPISLFAIMMISIIASLLIIIFSFSFGIIIGVIILNVGLFIALIKITNNPQLFHFSKPFPQIISNKKPTLFNYEED